jgi:hypothetical protein
LVAVVALLPRRFRQTIILWDHLWDDFGTGRIAACFEDKPQKKRGLWSNKSHCDPRGWIGKNWFLKGGFNYLWMTDKGGKMNE